MSAEFKRRALLWTVSCPECEFEWVCATLPESNAPAPDALRHPLHDGAWAASRPKARFVDRFDRMSSV